MARKAMIEKEKRREHLVRVKWEKRQAHGHGHAQGDGRAHWNGFAVAVACPRPNHGRIH